MLFRWKRPALLAALASLTAGWSLVVGPAPVALADDEAKKVTEGKPAPEVKLPATQIEKVLPDKKDAKTLNLKDLRGKKNVVLYFFPKALTGG